MYDKNYTNAMMLRDSRKKELRQTNNRLARLCIFWEDMPSSKRNQIHRIRKRITHRLECYTIPRM